MSHDPASQNASQPQSAAGPIDEACRRFVSAWRSGSRPRIDDCLSMALAQGSDAVRKLCARLVAIDLEYRWRPAAPKPAETVELPPVTADTQVLGTLPDRPKLEDYAARYPVLGPVVELPLELVVEEYRVRHRWGDRPGHDEYLRRFGPERPGLAERLDQTDRELAAGETIGQADLVDRAWLDAERSTPHPVAERRRLADYELLEKLGEGGMGVVYRARHLLLNQTVALKVLPEKYLDEPQAVSRFLREMHSIGSLNHPNIVRAHNAGEQEGIHFLVMEYVEGITLDRLVVRCAPLPVGAACELVRQAAMGLQHAHLHGLVHRDIKPANLMLNSAGTLKILDLGLARLRADQDVTRQLTGEAVSEPGIAIGTVDYMAPEQWEDASAVDIRADIYSLGCTLFCLLTGRAPYGKAPFDTLRKKLRAHTSAPIPAVSAERPDCPKVLDAVLRRMLAKEPSRRFATPAELADALSPLADIDELLDLLPAAAAPPESAGAASPSALTGSEVETWRRRQRRAPPGSPTRRPWYRRPAVLLAAVALAALASWLVRDWLAPRELAAWQRQLREDLGSLPGLKGNWWFDEIPWFVPAVRAELLGAIAAGEREIAGVPLREVAVSARDPEVQTLYDQLSRISQDLKKRIPDERERKLVSDVQVLLNDRDQVSPQSYREKLGEVKATIDAMGQSDTPTALHYRAIVQHELARYNLAEWSEAKASYQSALKKYATLPEDDATILRAMCMADYSQMLFDGRQYRDSVSGFQEARRGLGAPALVVATLGQEADASRKLMPIPNMIHALECLQEAEACEALAPDHALRAQIIERRAWVEMDSWQFGRAIASFREALRIRAGHEDAATADTTIFALWDRQGLAMAYHFLGEKQQVIEQFDALLADIPDAARTADHGERRKSERGPNVYESYADWFVFGPEPDYRRAVELLHEAVQQTEYLHFDDDFRAPYATRLRYKLQLAQALASPAAAPPTVPAPQTAATVPSPATQAQKDSEIFAEARDVAAAVIRLQGAVGQKDKSGTEPLLHEIAAAKPGTYLARSKVGFLLLAIEQVCNSQLLDPSQLRPVARQMIEIANVTSLGKDPGVRRFLRRYLESVDREVTRARKAAPDADLAKEQELIREWLRQE